MTGWRRSLVWGAVGVVCFILAWEALARAAPSTALPAATEVAAQVAAYLTTVGLWSAAGHTVLQWLLVMLISTAIAVPTGLLLGRNGTLRAYTASTISILMAIPAVALIPVFVVTMGSQLPMVVALTTFATLWSILIPTIDGARRVDPIAIDTARVFRIGRRRTFVGVIFPATLPSIATGLKVASVVALLVVIATQLIAGSPGLGQLMITAQDSGAIARTFALSVLAGVLGLLLSALVQGLERLYLPWYHLRLRRTRP